MIEGILIGLNTVIIPINLLLVVVGCFAGSIIGMLPGLGPISAIALLIPITYSYEPASAMILMAGIYYGAVFGGSTSSILINAPGISGTVATAFDGYPLAQKGHPGKALAVAAYSSFSGGTIAAIFLLVAAPVLAKVSLSFQSADYFALMILGMTAVSAFASKGKFLKAALMTIFGIMLSTVGTDLTAGVQRFTLGIMDLSDGISFILLAMATFALSEALMSALKDQDVSEKIRETIKRKMSSLKLSRKEVKEIVPTIGRSSVIGFLVGVLPGAGATIASFLAYGVERNIAKGKDKLEFGKGSLKGLAAPETANNAASSGSFVPLLTLGIPGSGTTAIILGALLSYGVQPGPRLFVDHPALFWSVIVSMYIGNVILLIINLPLIPYIAKILALPKNILVPFIIFFSLIGVYLVSFNTFDIGMMVVMASLAVALRFLDFPMPPMLLGFILGGMMEDNLRRALAINRGSMSFLWERPITLTILIITFLFLLKPMVDTLRNRRSDKTKSEG
ncbi:MAG: tripartite tricarboxylate transporter permease [Spirochaetales bacterium]|nr:tripartite tricarboxylate transporter permease [Spirochaetales bacterium]